MARIILCVLMLLSLAFSCATVKQPLSKEYWGLHKVEKLVPEDLYSPDEDVKSKNAAIFADLPDESKQQVLTYLAYTLSEESDPVIRAKVFGALTEFNAGPYVVVPLIEAAGRNKSPMIFREVGAFAARFKPSEIELKPLVSLLNDGEWNVRYTAAKIMGLKSKSAETALPEIFVVMRSYAGVPDRYADMYNVASMINPRIAILQVITDMKSRDPELSKTAINKMFELYMYLSKDSPIRKEILPALIRLMYSDDEILSKTSREMLSSIGDDESEKALKSYMALSKLAFNGAAEYAGEKLQDKFKKQEEDILDEIAVYYTLIGRSDAVKGIKK